MRGRQLPGVAQLAEPLDSGPAAFRVNLLPADALHHHPRTFAAGSWNVSASPKGRRQYVHCHVPLPGVVQMTSEDDRQYAQQRQDQLLVAEAAQLAAGWRFVTVDGIAVECEEDLELYEQVLFAFDEVARGRESRHASTSSRLALGIRSQDADQRIAGLRGRIDALNPRDPWSGRRWEIRDGAR